MKKLFMTLLLIFSATVCNAEYELKLNDGATMTWHEYTVEGDRYCTQKQIGKFCLQKADVVSLKEIKDDVSVSAGQTKSTERKKHSLWKISSNTDSIYILGSVHALKEDDYPLDTVIENVFDTSKKLYFEINLDTVDEKKLQQLTMAKGLYSGDQSLQKTLSKNTYEVTKKRLAGLGLNISQFEKFKPWFLAMTMTVLELQKLGFDANKGIDKYFYTKAKSFGKKVDGFETAEYQLSLLSDMSGNMEENFLLQSMAELDQMGAAMTLILDAWRSGDAKGLDSYLLKSLKEYPEIMNSLLIVRNKNWLPKIESLMGKSEKAMIILGTAHLVGKDGVIELLRQKGYKVEQL